MNHAAPSQLSSGWRTSTYSGPNGGSCVEVAPLEGVAVRDSKDRRRGHLTIPKDSWEALTAAIKD